MKVLACFAILIISFPVAGFGQNASMYKFWQREMAGFTRALSDPSVNQRVQSVWLKLVMYSGRMFPILPAQQFTLGQALPNGIVLVDLGVVGDAHEEVTAFWIAHEYAHQVKGDSQLLVSPVGRFIAAASGTRYEDGADRWAANFMADAGYRISPVLSFLCELPSGRWNRSHSPGRTRARNVAAAYGVDPDSACSGGRRRSGSNSCEYANDGECDEPELCARGTDTADCSRQTTGYDERCLQRMQRLCMRECVLQYGYSESQCRNRLCLRSVANMSFWGPRCAE